MFEEARRSADATTDPTKRDATKRKKKPEKAVEQRAPRKKR
jgi:hypothetical protein